MNTFLLMQSIDNQAFEGASYGILAPERKKKIHLK